MSDIVDSPDFPLVTSRQKAMTKAWRVGRRRGLMYEIYKQARKNYDEARNMTYKTQRTSKSMSTLLEDEEDEQVIFKLLCRIPPQAIEPLMLNTAPYLHYR